jgi:hypothetical protein
MYKVMSRAGLLVLILLLSLMLTAQETVKIPIPENVKISLDGLQTTRTANGVFNLKYQNAYFWALENAVYVNVVFTADLDSDIAASKNQLKAKYDAFVAEETKKVEEINKKISKEEDKKKWEAPPLQYPAFFHDLYMRILKDNTVIQDYRSHIPADSDVTAYYSFGTILAPGEYDVLLDVNRTDNTQDGTQLFKLSVPALTVMEIIKPKAKLEISAPVFYREVKQLQQSEERFTVVKNKYAIGPAKLDFFPFQSAENQFKTTENPILTFFIQGAVMVQTQGAEPWSISAKLEVRQGKEVISKFNEIKLGNPYFNQPLVFLKRVKEVDLPLSPGEYTLHIALVDGNSKDQQGKGDFIIPFKIAE